jgi:hypothetical protein
MVYSYTLDTDLQSSIVTDIPVDWSSACISRHTIQLYVIYVHNLNMYMDTHTYICICYICSQFEYVHAHTYICIQHYVLCIKHTRAYTVIWGGGYMSCEEEDIYVYNTMFMYQTHTCIYALRIHTSHITFSGRITP